jgi:hypothetical protein
MVVMVNAVVVDYWASVVVREKNSQGSEEGQLGCRLVGLGRGINQYYGSRLSRKTLCACIHIY